MIRVFGAHFFKIQQLHRESLFEFSRKLSTNSNLCVQYKSKAEELAERKRKDQEIRWTKLYHFTNMKYHSILTRLKVYPLLTGIIGTPVAYAIELSHTVPGFTFVPCLAISLTGTAMLSLYSATLANTIGIVYICQESRQVQIAYINFWGKQCFVESTVDELHKLEKSKPKFGLYKTISVNDNNNQRTLKLPWNTGDIFDIKLFRRCFGK